MKLKKYIDPKNPAKASEFSKMPKYYQMGTVVDGGGTRMQIIFNRHRRNCFEGTERKKRKLISGFFFGLWWSNSSLKVRKKASVGRNSVRYKQPGKKITNLIRSLVGLEKCLKESKINELFRFNNLDYEILNISFIGASIILILSLFLFLR